RPPKCQRPPPERAGAAGAGRLRGPLGSVHSREALRLPRAASNRFGQVVAGAAPPLPAGPPPVEPPPNPPELGGRESPGPASPAGATPAATSSPSRFSNRS